MSSKSSREWDPRSNDISVEEGRVLLDRCLASFKANAGSPDVALITIERVTGKILEAMTGVDLETMFIAVCCVADQTARVLLALEKKD